MKAIFSIVLLALVVGPGPAVGDPTVYVGGDPINLGEPKPLRANLSEEIDLYVCVRSADGCSTDPGDKLHGIDVIVTVEGGGQLTGFVEGDNVVHWPEGASFPTSKLRLNVVQAISPPSAGAQFLGRLTLHTGTTGCSVKVEGEVVDAHDQVVPVHGQVMGAQAEVVDVYDVLKSIPTRIIASAPAIPQCDGPDNDSDSTGDACDNCDEKWNADQTDSDRDGYGNACDADFNQDDFCGGPDFTLFLQCYNKSTGPGVGPPDDPDCEACDMNGDGFVGGPDFTLFLQRYNKPPGPSGLPCAGTTVPCP
jgi:hypothetical protein